ncbi:MAG: helix-turn-helix domain-containing protein [Gammaproteobacteria bacterium]|nr:helix-turn-helix domain-containing protein [Gammaproteobacteria bacterium]
MVMQLQKTTKGEVVPITTSVGYARPSLEVLSCSSCDNDGACLAEQLTITHGLSYEIVKNRRIYARGKHIYHGGEAAQALYVVSSGTVKSYILMEDGEEQVLNFYMPGDVIGLDSMGSDCHVASTIALEETTICKLPLSCLQDRVLGQDFLNTVSYNILRDHNMLLMLARKNADGRMASFLLDMVKRVERRGCSVDVIKLVMTRQDIANYLGLAIETVSRTLRRFQDSGMLEVTRRKIRIFDFDCLRMVAGAQVSR